MTPSGGNRFEDFFADDAYRALKNSLYNYLLRKRSVEAQIQDDEPILEVGSGLSPMVTDPRRVIYSDLSFSALQTLRQFRRGELFVVADATHLPFKPGSFPQVICSEVLEHLPDDRAALRQIARVMKPGGSLILTFPHRRDYFAVDDRFVRHFRRYELREMEGLLREVGLAPLHVQKVLGPLEKMTMALLTWVISCMSRSRTGRESRGKRVAWPRFAAPLFTVFNRFYCLPVWIDARLAPRTLASVLLIRAVK